MNGRPEDIPAAVRDAFADHRIGSAWNLVVSAEPNERLAALLGFERLMAARGLGLADVAVAVAALPQPVVLRARERDPDDPSMDRSVFAGFGGSFSRENARQTPPPPSAPPGHAARTRIEMRGPAVPETVIGRIRIEERRANRGNGEMLVFVAEAEDRTYGPLAAYAGPQIAHLVEAERSNWIMRLMIQTTHSDRILPRVRRIETV